MKKVVPFPMKEPEQTKKVEEQQKDTLASVIRRELKAEGYSDEQIDKWEKAFL